MSPLARELCNSCMTFSVMVASVRDGRQAHCTADTLVRQLASMTGMCLLESAFLLSKLQGGG